MVWPIRSRISSLLFANSPLVASHVYESWWFSRFSGPTSSSLTRPWPKVMDWIQIDRCRTAASLPSIKEKQTESPDYCVRLDGENQGTDKGNMSDGYQNLFGLMKQRFMSFKNQKYIKELEHFQVLAEAQSPKFMVIACADSRVCPSNILGFQPGDAFMIRNIANLVPPMKNGPSECNAALQFAVTTLRRPNGNGGQSNGNGRQPNGINKRDRAVTITGRAVERYQQDGPSGEECRRIKKGSRRYKEIVGSKFGCKVKMEGSTEGRLEALEITMEGMKASVNGNQRQASVNGNHRRCEEDIGGRVGSDHGDNRTHDHDDDYQEVENILVIGHSSCAGIETLMNMQDDAESRNFIHKWVANGELAKLKTTAATAHLSFDQQCRFCEKESINQSLLNLLSYPWIEDRVRRELLSLHGGYYNFNNCSFEKWTLDFERCNVKEEGINYVVKEQDFWS
ncbi:hypothetical protein LR48_Vigan07g132800 [Vigna angularis]|uniref:carbonic anhydrase n=1 Tax=Phaseolus angularis TaxID=3914 RepID=A0A0L9UYK6_PHAAN|nr:hypothetical protein LR48_Vigan07g132800 [Vigna angularis]